MARVKYKEGCPLTFMSKLGKIVTHHTGSEQITKQEINSELTQDFFVTYKKNADKYFESLENSIPKYYQTIHELHQEYLQVWENMFNATISIQKAFVSKTGLNTSQSSAANEFVSDATEAAIKARTVRDEVILKSIETATENLKAWNKHWQGFAETNRKIAQFWISVFTARQI